MINIKKLTSIIIAASLICAFPAYAASDSQIQAAVSLYSMGLFSGTGTNSDGTPVFDLDAPLTRAQGTVILVNLLGCASKAENGSWSIPFDDVPEWAQKYVGYAYNSGYVSGRSAGSFDPDSYIDANQFCAFILRALGFSEANGDFKYENALDTAVNLGIAEESYEGFTRGDAVLIAFNALAANINHSSLTLSDTLLNSGAISDAENTVRVETLKENSEESDELTAEEIYEKCSPAVFYIEVYDANGRALQLGSGFFISSDGTAVTNYHVIDGGSSAKITLSDTGEVYDVQGVYDYDKERDIALIKINGSGFSYLETADSDNIKGGATVYAIGSPLGLSNSISQGLISNTDREIGGMKYIQTSAAISNGSSGGALINTKGHVIGITSGEAAQTTSSGTLTGQNLNLAIPINAIKALSTDSLSSLSEIYKAEAAASTAINVSADDIILSRGETAVVYVTCESSVTAGLKGSITSSEIISAHFMRTMNGATLVITGLSSGTADVNLKMVSLDGTVLNEKTINVTVR